MGEALRSIDHDRKLLSLQILPYLWKEALLEKSTSQKTRAYHLHFVDIESSAFSLRKRPGVLQTHTVTQLAAHARHGLINVSVMWW